jgi:hypothetical protein
MELLFGSWVIRIRILLKSLLRQDMTSESNRENGRRTKRNKNLQVVEVKCVQVPDAQERLARVFKILMSNFTNEVAEK